MINSIVIGGLMPRVVLSFAPQAPDWALDRRLWILLAMTLLCPLAFLRRLDSLKVTSYISLCAVGNLVSDLSLLGGSAFAYASLRQVFVVIYKSCINQSGLPPKGPVHLIALGPRFVQSLPVQVGCFGRFLLVSR